MVSSNIAVTRSELGVVQAEVIGARRISPHFVRITLAGPELGGWRQLGYDQWFRLAVPTNEHTRFDNLADNFDVGGYLKYLTLPKSTRPVIRNYTVREHRPADRELDIDFVVHGDAGVAGPWADTLPVGQTVGLIDQGCGYVHSADDTDTVVLVGDESALPAVLGILRDLPRDTRGAAIIEIPHADDRQAVEAPDGMAVQWVVRDEHEPIGRAALERLRELPAFEGRVAAFAAGESKLATGARRHLVNERGVPKASVSFCGYWRARH